MATSNGAGAWLPPNYDVLGVDGYNRYNCRHTAWRPFSLIFQSSRDFAVTKAKPLYVIESGCVEGEPGRKAQWMNDARATMKTWPEVMGLSYNHEDTDCSYYVDSTASSLSALTETSA